MDLTIFDNWERESLRLFRKQDLEILLDNFVEKDVQEDFLHNLADMLFRLNENLTKHNSRKTQSAKIILPQLPKNRKRLLSD